MHRDFDAPYEIESSRQASSLNSYEDHYKNKGLVSPSKDGDKKEEKPKLSEEELAKKKQSKAILRFLLTNLGLIVSVMLYLIGGAYLFQILEQHNEIQTCQQGQGADQTMISTYSSTLFNYIFFNTTTDPYLANSSSVDGPNVYNPKIATILSAMRDDVLTNKDTYKYYGQDCEADSYWQLPSALLFVITIVTTIGYGHVTPVTWEGQIVCICYATLGIPLFLMTVANTSGILANMIRFLYTNIFCSICVKHSRKKRQEERARERAERAMISKPQNTDDADYWNSYYQKHIAKMDDDLNKKQQKQKIDLSKPNERVNDENVEDDDDDDWDDDEDEINVPISVVVVILLVYIICGGLLFQELENDMGWTFGGATYFCYITFSTVGFGDYVPGIVELTSNPPDVSTGTRNLYLGCVYAFFGIVILAMCFDLMSSELKEKGVLIGTKLGLIKEPEEDEESDVEDDVEEKKDGEDFPSKIQPKSEKDRRSTTPNKLFIRPESGYQSQKQF